MLEIGIKLFNIRGSSLSFFWRSRTTAFSKPDGTEPINREQVLIDNICGPAVGNTFFRNLVDLNDVSLIGGGTKMAWLGGGLTTVFIV